ncbi:MAG: phosphotransferase enzyme family protein [Acidimicrobiales bacterium]
MDLAERVAAALGLVDAEELTGGHQSRVFRVTGPDGHPAVAKALDASIVDRSELDVRLDTIAALAELDPRVCRPLVFGPRRIVELSSVDDGEHYVVCYEFAPGRTPDPARPTDAHAMGAALAHLHRSMARLPATTLPVVGPLRAVAAHGPTRGPDRQLLHGDFNAGNLRSAAGVIRVFDLDDCGYGPPAFDVANALYMVLFDTVVRGTPERYEIFRRSFVEGYVGAADTPLSDERLDHFVDLRVDALDAWLDDLAAAPVGIRTASASWRATLRRFVSHHRATAR